MKKSLLKNTFVRTTFLMLMSALVLTSCKKDNTEPSPASGTEFTVPVCNPIITEGCDPMNHVIDTMDFPYIDINQLIGRGAERNSIEPSFWENAGMWVLGKVGNTIASSLFSPLGTWITTSLFGNATQEKLDKILDQLTVIENDINTLMAQTEQALIMLDGNGYNDLSGFHENVQKLLTALNVENKICETNLKNIYDNSQNYNEEQLNTAVADVMRTWGNKTIEGNSAYVAFDQLYNYLTSPGYMYNGKLRNLFAIYDVIVFHNTPWEKTGYDMRDMFRAAVAAEAVRTAWLTTLYYRTVIPDGFQYFTSGLTTKIENLSSLFASSSNSVNRRYDKVVCQLSGALFILDADALEEHKGWTFTRKYDWYPLNGTKHVFSQGTITSSSNDVTAARNSQLTNSQISQITTYYEPYYGRDYTILNCLEDGGLIVPSYYNTIFINNNGNPYNIQYYEEVYLLSQETTMNVYITDEALPYLSGPGFLFPIRGNVLLRLSGLYNVGIPLSCTEAAGFSCHGYLPDFQKDSFYNEGADGTLLGLDGHNDYEYFEYFTSEDDRITIDGVTYTARLTKWHADKGYTYTFPGKYVLWFKTGSLQLYDKFSI